MSESKLVPGQLAWLDLTVADAERVRDSYRAVIGWEPSHAEDFSRFGAGR